MSDEYERLQTAFEGIEPPFALVDLDALRDNARSMVARASGKPIRVASKSIRCRAVLDLALSLDDAYRGSLNFTLEEALFLAEHGHEDLLVAYPTADRKAIAELARFASEHPERAPTLMVDDPVQLDLIEGAVGRGTTPIKVAIDIDVGYELPGGIRQVGPKRSPIRTPDAARELAEDIVARPSLELDGLMGYEGQVAGVGDDAPGAMLKNAAIRLIQSRSMDELIERRVEIVRAVSEVAELRFVNGGGTGSLERTAADPSVTELAAGSGFYAPALFDHYRSFELRPAAMFALAVVRRPAPGVVTALGGGYLASGPASGDRLPVPYLPEGLRFDGDEGAGEVQTPLLGQAALKLRIGDRVFMRHAKAGELCERFNSLYLLEGGEIIDEVPTYRGEGKAFL